MKNYAYHSLADQYPPMPQRELDAIVDAMLHGGYRAEFPVVLYQGRILDGRNRYLAAQLASVEATFVTFEGSEEEAARFVRDANEHRRHLSQEWLEERRKERMARVVSKRAEGKSTRQIAEEEGVSQKRIIDDLKDAAARGMAQNESGDKGYSPDSSREIIGKDKKKYASTRPPKLCPRCQVVAPALGVRDCKGCAELRRGGARPKEPEATSDQEGSAHIEPPTDAELLSIPFPDGSHINRLRTARDLLLAVADELHRAKLSPERDRLRGLASQVEEVDQRLAAKGWR
jgi:hypothetical protein